MFQYTGNGETPATIAHGLGKKPGFFIISSNSTTQNYSAVWHKYTAELNPDNHMVIETNTKPVTTGAYWAGLEPDDEFIYIGDDAAVNTVDEIYTCYCWTEIEGYSKIDWYKANNNANGIFFDAGFEPEFLLVKCISANYNWFLYSGAVNPNNPVSQYFNPNATTKESALANSFDWLSQGWKARTSSTNINYSSYQYVYMAFAKSPFGGSNTYPNVAHG
jgi:hypothetical protein